MYPQPSEANGNFYVERTSGTDKPAADEDLHRSIWTEENGAPKQLCRARYQITPRVTWRAEAPK